MLFWLKNLIIAIKTSGFCTASSPTSIKSGTQFRNEFSNMIR
jgi:hypothetical protein